MPITGQDAYQQIKNIEPDWPLLEPRAIVVVGTINQTTRQFTSAVPLHTWEWVFDPPVDPPPAVRPNLPNNPVHPLPPFKVYKTAAVVNANSVFLTLRFEIAERNGNFKVECGDRSGVAAPEQNYVDVDLSGGVTPGLNFLDCNFLVNGVPLPLSGPATNAIMDGNLQVAVLQACSIAAGGFIMSALPVQIVYAPPQVVASDTTGYFYSQLTTLSTTSRSITTSVSSTNSTKTSTAYTLPDFITKIASAISEVSSIAQIFADPSNGGNGKAPSWAKPLSDFLNLFSGILGQTTQTDVPGYTSTNTTKATVTVTDTSQAATFPGPGLGPGVGDLFIFLKNVRVLWVASDGALGLTFVGCDGEQQYTVQDLQNGKSGLDAATVQALLSLDPFVGQPPYFLSPQRFLVPDQPPNGQETFGPGEQGSVATTYTITDEDMQTSVQTNTLITDYKPSWLAALFGDNETTENTLTTSYTTSDDTTVGETITDTVYYKLPPTDPNSYAIDFWYDLLFGNMAYVTHGQETQTAPVPALRRTSLVSVQWSPIARNLAA
jgi:hypothetical protein